ncbi:MAG TPA: GNAT family N-acetyltransferase [Sphingomicrobium sp.]|nr:GNAT family N-acetyltransferase [Sphingomicrobium sp.]
MTIPTLETDRLILRAPAAADFPAYRTFYSNPEASAFYGGPLSPVLAWRKLAFDLGHWAIRGFGMWSVIERETGSFAGGCGIVWPEGWPRHELTWWIIPSARRRGLAFEASRAVIAWGYNTLAFDPIETHMNDDNAAARRLAEKLGGIRVAREEFPDGLSRDVFALPRP